MRVVWLRVKNEISIVTCVTIVTLLIGGILGVSCQVLAISTTLTIHIDQRPPFFSPSTVSTVVGTVVQWENRTGEAHSIRADDCVRRASCSFESRMIEPGGNFVVPHLPPGEYAYHCGIHPFMQGLLIVKGKRPRMPSTADI